MLSSKCCFYCKYYYHLNPDDDACSLLHQIVFYYTPACSYFTVQDAEDLITDNFND